MTYNAAHKGTDAATEINNDRLPITAASEHVGGGRFILRKKNRHQLKKLMPVELI